MLQQLTVGDQVLTVGGMYGVVRTISADGVDLQLAPGLSTRVVTDAIARVVGRGQPIQVSEPEQGSLGADPVNDEQREHVMNQNQATPRQTTFKARVDNSARPTNSSIPTFEPRPWGDLIPVQNYSAPLTSQPAPVVLPFQSSLPIIETANVGPKAEMTEARRHSKAPQGMGSNLRLDDPSISESMARARSERAELATEYRKLTAPLVDLSLSEEQTVQAPTWLPTAESRSQPLFASSGAPMAHPTSIYPAPSIQPPAASGFPRPMVDQQQEVENKISIPQAFQRRAPYAPTRSKTANAL